MSLKSGWQEHDIWYVVDRVKDTYRQEAAHVIQRVVAKCKEEVQPSDGREKLLALAKERMRAMIEASGERK